MLHAGFWGVVGASTLLVGAVFARRGTVSQRSVELATAFGSAALISVLAFNLDEHAYELAGGGGAVGGFVTGALVFFVVDRILDNRGAAYRKRSNGPRPAGRSERAIALGTALDAVPESVLIAFTIVEGGDVGGAVVAAVFLSNLGESLAGSTGLRKAGVQNRLVVRMWSGVVLVAGISAMLGYVLFNSASDGVVGFGQAFATGAALCMVADTMLPEAFQRDEPLVGIVIALGFILGFSLSIF